MTTSKCRSGCCVRSVKYDDGDHPDHPKRKLSVEETDKMTLASVGAVAQNKPYFAFCSEDHEEWCVVVPDQHRGQVQNYVAYSEMALQWLMHGDLDAVKAAYHKLQDQLDLASHARLIDEMETKIRSGEQKAHYFVKIENGILAEKEVWYETIGGKLERHEKLTGRKFRPILPGEYLTEEATQMNVLTPDTYTSVRVVEVRQ